MLQICNNLPAVLSEYLLFSLLHIPWQHCGFRNLQIDETLSENKKINIFIWFVPRTAGEIKWDTCWHSFLISPAVSACRGCAVVVVVVVAAVCVLAVDVDARLVAGEAADPPHLTDRLLNNKHQDKDPATNYDVQIGDGMDIVIVGENGKAAFTEIIMCNYSFPQLPNFYLNFYLIWK